MESMDWMKEVNEKGSGCPLSTSVAAIMTKMVHTAITITNGIKEQLLVLIPHQSFRIPHP